MSPVTRIICLANSQKYGDHCVAGINPETGEWIRPVSDLDDGRLPRPMRLVGGREPHLLEILRIPLASHSADPEFQIENRSVLPGTWTGEGYVPVGEVRGYCRETNTILGSEGKYRLLEDILKTPPGEKASLELVEARRFEPYHRGRSAQGGHKWFGRLRTTSGACLDARITDPVFIEKIEAGYHPPPGCLITVSLTKPYTPQNWEKEENPCWKVIAAVIEPDQPADPAAEKRSRRGAAFSDAVIDEGRKLRSPGDSGAPQPAGSKDSMASDAAAHTSRGMGRECSKGDIYRALQHNFGYSQFRPHQQSVVRALLDGRDAVAVMPSGGGKSLCYQLPASLLPGTCVVISPLISLMKDQVDGAAANGLRAACFNSSLDHTERLAVLERLGRRELDLLYVSPERLVMDRFRSELKRSDISFFAIDEAHCISDWGHDFRPDYLDLSRLKPDFPQTPVAAFTATATPPVRRDIATRLGLENPHKVLASFNRPNFFYQVVPKQNDKLQILEFIKSRPGESGIVYRTTRNDVDSTAGFLQGEGVSALPYHAGLDTTDRQKNQDAFCRDEVDVIVATIAFGMGIDKPDVRYVVHGDLPKNLESYYQETGRAGRDGLPAHCLLLFSEGDALKIKYFIDQEDDPHRRRLSLEKINQMIRFASVNVCRRRQLLGYFGEEYGEDSCDSCDICTEQVERADATCDAQIVMSATWRTGERYGIGKIVDIVTGANTEAVRKLRLDEVKTYGAGADKARKHWRHIVDELIGQECLIRTDDRYPVLRLSEKGKEVLFGRRRFEAARRGSDFSKPASAAEDDGGDITCDIVLFDKLRKIRRELADGAGMPPFTVFHDRTLEEMAYYYPTTPEKMLAITGVGEVKLRNYGGIFMRAIGNYLSGHPDIEPPAGRVKGEADPQRPI